MVELKGNSLKMKLSDNRLTIGSWLSLPSPATAEIMARAGFEWLVVDLEHSVVERGTLEAMFRAMELQGCIPLVHLSGKDPVQVKRGLDAGAYGVIVPMVNNPAEAKAAVQSVKYPPWGTRGVDRARAQGYGSQLEEYEDVFNEESIIIVQIGHQEAVENIDGILSEEGLDGVFIDPNDISSSYSVPGQLDHPLVTEAERRVREACDSRRISAGIHVVSPEKDHLERKIQEGFKLIAYGVDMLFLNQACREGVQEISELTSQSNRWCPELGRDA